ncbi:MAG: LytR C-terminal domain-containing protein [Brevinematales bacterium]|nr:LytR C-terminal domain-containing protein [Brevinematales bacterium]
MIDIYSYRKLKLKKKKVRNWVLLALILVTSFITLALLSSISSNSFQSSYHNIVVSSNTIIVNLTKLDLDSTVWDDISKHINSKDSFVKIIMEGNVVAYYSCTNPEISVLNAKKEQDLAMNVSLHLLRKGFNIKNYGNFPLTLENSYILNRTPNKEVVYAISKILKIKVVSNFVFDENLKDDTSGIIVILGKDFDVKRMEN